MRPWDALCFASIIGIWPRWIEPSLLLKKRLHIPFRIDSPLKIAHFSDLHFGGWSVQRQLDRLVRLVSQESPDLILFTGDFLNFSLLPDPDGLLEFLRRFSAPLGCFASPGNHDYSGYPSRNEEGLYDLGRRRKGPIEEALKLLKKPPLREQVRVTEAVRTAPIHPELEAVLADSPFHLLHNASIQLPCGINVAGLGDAWMGHSLPERAFEGWNKELSGIVLSHNPDTLATLLDWPGDLILSGHTHGSQIHLPWIGCRLAGLQDPTLRRGLVRRGEKRIYISGGVGAAEPFRLFSPPDVTFIHLEPES